MKKTIFAVMMSFSLFTMASDDVVKDASNKDKESDFSQYVFKIIESTQAALDEAYDGIESQMAETVKTSSKKLLAKPIIFKALINSAKIRFEADIEEADDEDAIKDNKPYYASMAMAGLQTQLRQVTGAMTKNEMIARARIISDVAKYYNRKDPSMCRYLPQDFSVLLNIESEWVAEVDEERLENAIEAEIKAIERVYKGVDSVIVADVDTQALFSKFASEWFSGISEQEKERISVSRNSGNYCVLWSIILNDAAKMSEVYPSASRKILLPLMTMPTRGWLDVDKWGFKPIQ